MFLSILLISSLVLPFVAKAQGREETQNTKSRTRTVWIGQLFVAMGGLLIILLPRYSVFGFIVAMAACGIFTFQIRAQVTKGALAR